MKKSILLLCFLCIGKIFFSQTFEPFNFTGALNANGWTTHSGTTPGQFQADNAGSLTYPNLAASAGNKANFVAGNGEDVNKAVTISSDSAYYSLLLNVPSSTQLQLNTNTTGDIFFGFGQTAGATLTVFGGQLRIRQGSVANTFQIALVNSGAGGLIPSVFSQDLQIGETYFLVVKLRRTTSPIQATLWINPVPGTQNPPASSQYSTQGTNAFSAFASVFMRQSGTVSAGTGNLQIDEIRVGTTWESVTPCAAPVTFYADSDGDFFGNPNSTISACTAPFGYVSNNTDCDDSNASINPNTIWYADVDGDTYGNSNATFAGCVPPNGFVLNSSDCDDSNPTLNVLVTYYQDLDQDGFGNPAVSISNCGQPTGYVSNNTDCDDSNNQINPNATEIADNIDNDCDGLTDEGFAILTWYLDSDQDGFGGIDSVQSILSPGANYILIDGDCNDQDLSINPNAQEICDSIDNNCDGLIDNGLTFLTYYVDADGDTYGNTNDSIVSCSQPIGYVLNYTDCDDSNASINPGATDVPENGIDEDCNGVDAPLVPLNLGMYQFLGTVDCAAQDNAVIAQPLGATFSLFNGVGTNCATAGGVFNRSGWNTLTTIDLNQYNEFSIVAENCKKLNLDRVAFKFRPSGSAGSPIWHLRSSVDNYATDIDFGTGVNVNNAYSDDTVFLVNHTNIDQVNFRFYITEIQGSTTTWRMDDISLYGNIISVTPQIYFADSDNDGFGDSASDTSTCLMPSGFVLDNSDCNDQDSLINPISVWYLDADNDLIGDSSVSFTGCTPPSGYVLSAGDCDDNNTQITGSVTYYLDGDGDTFGETSSAQTLCQNPGVGYVTIGGDCNDLDPLINPSASEICDGIDNDCDGIADDSLTFTMYYVDADGDGFGDEATGVESCSQPQNTITIGGDCDDTNDQIYPGATEVCDAVDNDCDGSTDEGLTFITYYMDADNDGFGTGSTGLSFCENPGPGFSTNNQDCNDSNGQINPNATDILDNGIDENCDGVDGYLGIQVISKMNVTVSPNPNDGSFTIEFNQLVLNAEIKLTDLNGKVVLVYQLCGGSIQISDKNLEKGVYLLNVSIQGNTLIERILVQ